MEIEPVAYYPEEEVALGKSLVIHFEKAVLGEKFKCIFLYINQAFACILPQKYEKVNREQDLGKKGLWQAKESCNPVGFMKRTKFGLNSI